MYPVRIEGQTTILREFRDSDVVDALAVVGDDEITRWLSFDSRTEEQTASMLEGVAARAREQPRTEYYLAIALPDDDRLIGFARLGLDGVKAGKLGYAVRASHQRHGYTSDATRALIAFGFSDLGLHRISAAIGPDNTASIAMIRRLGFRHEGRIRDHVYTNGAWRDSELYSLLENEWTPTEPELPDDWWTTDNVAAFLNVSTSTVSSYVTRNQMPGPDRRMGRTRLWRPATIRQWHGSRPRQPELQD